MAPSGRARASGGCRAPVRLFLGEPQRDPRASAVDRISNAPIGLLRAGQSLNQSTMQPMETWAAKLRAVLSNRVAKLRNDYVGAKKGGDRSPRLVRALAGRNYFFSSMTAWAADRMAMGTR